MARIISETQKKEVFKALPSNYTIEGIAFNNVSKKYANQLTENSAYPIITLNYPLMGGRTDINDIAGVRYYNATLTIHILAKSASGLHGAAIAEGIAQGIIDEITGWELSPITGGTMIISRMRDIKQLQNNGYFPDIAGVFDYVLSIDLSHT